MKILVVGCGSIGLRHAQNAARIVDDVSVYDSDPSRATATGLKSFPSLDEALSSGPEGVIVAVPHKAHIDIAQKAIDAGAHVLIEKPISDDVKSARPFLDRAQKAGKRVHVVCNMRFHPAVKTLRENLKRIGNIYYARAHYGHWLPNMRPDSDYKKLYCAHKNQGGGVIFDAIHEIDYLTWLFGPAESVACEAGKMSNLDIDVEDYASIILSHEKGIRSEIHLDYLQHCKRRGCEIAGDQGLLVWSSEGKNPEHCLVRLYSAADRQWHTLLEDKNLDSSGMYVDVIKKFVSGGGGLLDGRAALAGLETAQAAHKAAASGKTVAISLDEPHTRASAYKG